MKTFTLDQLREWDPCDAIDKIYIPEGQTAWTVIDILQYGGMNFEDKLWVVCREILMPKVCMIRFANACYNMAHIAFTSKGKKMVSTRTRGERAKYQYTHENERIVKLQENFHSLLDPRKVIHDFSIPEHVRRDTAHTFLLLARTSVHVSPARLAARSTAKFAGRSAAWSMRENFIPAHKEVQEMQKQILIALYLEEIAVAQATIHGAPEQP